MPTRRFALYTAVVAASLFTHPAMADISGDELQSSLDTLWVVIAAALVFLMQAGFTALEAGSIRAKNSYNVAIKNAADFMIAFMGFWLVGFMLMFGTSNGGWLGELGLAQSAMNNHVDYAFFLFQAMFVGTAATIVAGAVAERMKFRDYLYASVAISCVIYPVSGHWIWGGALDGGELGWLAQKGFIDFAGSTVVHSVGGWVALAGALVLGPRIGRFNDNGSVNDIPGHNLLLTTLGVFLLWFGWFGFNGGSTLAVNADIPKILINTNLSAVSAGLAVLLISLVVDAGKVNILKVLNGALAGLVGITAGCQVVEPSGAILIGLFSGVILYASESTLLHWMKVDDPIGAVAVHGVCGAWGTIALALFAPAAALSLDSRAAQLGVQSLGVITVFGWAFGSGFLFFWVLKQFTEIRVSAEEEAMGLNVAEHDAKTIWLDTMNTMQTIVQSNDLSIRAPVEAGTEAGETAMAFNQLLDKLEQSVSLMADVSHKGLLAAKRVNSRAGSSLRAVDSQNLSTQHANGLMEELSASTQQLAQSTHQTANATATVKQQAALGADEVTSVRNQVSELVSSIEQISSTAENLRLESASIGQIISLIREVAEQTNLLALNAAIEAARAGEHGRGFSVVAEEVRNLANRTATATTDIETRIDQLQSEITQLVNNMSRGQELAGTSIQQSEAASQSLQVINETIADIHAMNQQIAEAASVQESATFDLRQQLSEIGQHSSELRGQSQEFRNSSDELQREMGQLSSLAATFQAR